jgi:hypothetical protein
VDLELAGRGHPESVLVKARPGTNIPSARTTPCNHLYRIGNDAANRGDGGFGIKGRGWRKQSQDGTG